MPELDALLFQLREQNQRLVAMDNERDRLKRKRDDTVRDARAAGASWAALQATGMSKDTVSKALDTKP